MRRTSFLSLLLLFFFATCGPEKVNKGPFKVFALVETKNGSNKTYELKRVELKTLENLNTMTGKAAQFFSASLFLNEKNATKNELKTHYVIKEGAAFPTDMSTLTAFSAYYHFEKLYTFWMSTGLIDEEIFSNNTIFLEPTYNSNVTYEKREKRNASFSPDFNALNLLKSDTLGPIPFKMSAPILAHEFGHKILFYLWANQDPEFYAKASKEEEKKSHDAHRSLDEGLADWASYFFTGDPKGIYDALGGSSNVRKLGNDDTIENYPIEKGKERIYPRGFILTQALYELEIEKKQKRTAITKNVFEALKKFRVIWKKDKLKTKPFLFSVFINEIISEAKASEANVTDTLITKPYCDVFLSRYTVEGNKEAITQHCKKLGVVY